MSPPRRYEAYPSWLAVHPDERCPRSLDELNDWMNRKGTLDPWGNPYSWYCVAASGGTAKVVVISLGEDQRADTADDVRSD